MYVNKCEDRLSTMSGEESICEPHLLRLQSYTGVDGKIKLGSHGLVRLSAINESLR